MIRDPYWFFQNSLTIDEIETLHQTIKKNPTKEKDSPANVKKTARVNIVRWKDLKEQLNIIPQNINIANRQNFGFQLYPLDDAFMVNINVYEASNKSEYEWHNDMGGRAPGSDQKLTVILNISQTVYTGGQLFVADSAPREVTHLNKPGAMVVFPCYIPHKVMPVTQGKRTTLSLWVLGPNFV